MMLRALDNSLRPEAPAANREMGIPKAIFFIRFRKVTAAAESAGRKDKVMQTFAVGNIFGVCPDSVEGLIAHIPDDVFF
jgi:hypothetical protein